MRIDKLLPIFKTVLGIFKKKVDTNEELKVDKFKYGHKWLMAIGSVLGFVIVIDNIFNLGVGSYIYDMFQMILEYFMS